MDYTRPYPHEYIAEVEAERDELKDAHTKLWTNFRAVCSEAEELERKIKQSEYALNVYSRMGSRG